MIAIALLLAAVATAGVYLYISGLEENKEQGLTTVEVVVAKSDIPVGTSLDEVISDGGFDTAEVLEDSLVSGAVTDLAQLEGRVTSAAILAGEQISTARLEGSDALPGGALGIPDGFEAITVPLDTARVVASEIRDNDNVTVYATFSLGGADQARTVALVPQAQVLKIGAPGEDGPGSGSEMLVTLALRPLDAQRLVFAQEQGSVWMSLLPPDQDGRIRPTVGLPQVLR